jgi:hypothetical protein
MRSALVALVVALPFVVGTAGASTGPSRHEVFRFADPAIVESSGLVVVGGRFVTDNDSGDSARVFTVDPATGRTVGVTSWAGAAVDDESLAPAGAGAVWVGDTGDNTASRDTIAVVQVPVGPGTRTVTGERYTLRYPRGQAQDAETLLSDPATGRLYVVSKSVLGGHVYAAPRTLRAGVPNQLRGVGPAVLPIATDGAFWPDGRHVLLRDYAGAALYDWPSLEQVGAWTLPRQRQGEGLAVTADGRVYVSSEGQRQPVYEVPLPSRIERLVAPPAPPNPAASPSASPSTSRSGSYSREGRELPEATSSGRSPGQWLLGTGLLLVAGLALWRALRPH